MKQIAILGSTGSIGTQALEVIALHPDQYQVSVLAAYQNDELLESQIMKYQPTLAVLVDEKAAGRLKSRYIGTTRIISGEEGLMEAAALPESDIVLTAMVGASGIKPTIAALEAGKDIALANKETLVAAGEIVTKLAAQTGSRLLPVDSEHSALFQCLQGEKSKNIAKLILTASGGPFRGFTREQLQHITVEQCLQHPNWSMGRKITVDSATLINKGLEVIEAKWLFDVPIDCVEVVVHPQSIVHSMIEFIDGSTMAQMGRPDMRLPIQYAFSWPERLISPAMPVDWRQVMQLDFMPPDINAFPGLRLAYEVGRVGGTLPCVFNAANEVAVGAFLDRRLPFLAIAEVVEETLARHTNTATPQLADIFAADEWSRQFAKERIHQKIGRC